MPKTAPSSVLAKMLGTPKGSRRMVISSASAPWAAGVAGWAAVNKTGMSASRRTTGGRRLSIANLLDGRLWRASSCGAPGFVVSVKERFVRSAEVVHGPESARGAGAGGTGGAGAGDGRGGHRSGGRVGRRGAGAPGRGVQRLSVHDHDGDYGNRAGAAQARAGGGVL